MVVNDYWQQIVNLAKQGGALDVRVTHNNKIIAHLAARLNALAKVLASYRDRLNALEKRVEELEEMT